MTVVRPLRPDDVAFLAPRGLHKMQQEAGEEQLFE